MSIGGPHEVLPPHGFAIAGKILEVEPVAAQDERVREVHPEVSFHALSGRLCYQKMSSARMSRGETLVLVMRPAQDRPTHDLALAPGR